MLLKELDAFNILLASASPRRKELLTSLGVNYQQGLKIEVEESFPEDLSGIEIPQFLAELKSLSYPEPLSESEILITADTIVYQDAEVLLKPTDEEDAMRILKKISGNSHFVYTGVCLRSSEKIRSFVAETEVNFASLSDEELRYYVQEYKPYDKAGAYGIQEWIGFIGVESIKGSYFNVMGLPIHQLYRELELFIK